MKNFLNSIKKFLILVLLSLPGIYFAATGARDVFASIAVVLMAFLLAAVSGFTMALLLHINERYQEFKTAKKNIPGSMKTTLQVAFWGWIIVVVAAFILAGTSGFGVAIYGAFVGHLDRKLRRESFDEMVDELLKDKPTSDLEAE